MPLASVDTDTETNGITWPKSQFAPYCDHLDISNIMVLLTMPSVSCDADASASGVIILKVMLYFILSCWPKECKGAIKNSV